MVAIRGKTFSYRTTLIFVHYISLIFTGPAIEAPPQTSTFVWRRAEIRMER